MTQAAPASAVLNGTFNVAATASSGLPVAITTSGACSGSGTASATITMTASSGTCTVLYNQAGNGTFAAASQVTNTTTATAGQLTPQTITVTEAAPASAALNGTFHVAATASSGLPVAIGGRGACTGSGSGSATITAKAAGTCTVTYTQAGNASFAAAPPVISTTSVTGTTNPAPTITGLVPTHTPAGTAFTLTVNGTGFVSTSTVNFERQIGQHGADAERDRRDAADGRNCRLADPGGRHGFGDGDEPVAGRRHVGCGDADAGRLHAQRTGGDGDPGAGRGHAGWPHADAFGRWLCQCGAAGGGIHAAFGMDGAVPVRQLRQPPGAAGATVTLTVTAPATSTTTAVPFGGGFPSVPSPPGGTTLVATFSTMLAALLLAARRLPQGKVLVPVRLAMVLWLVALAGLFFSVASCGGGFSGGTQNSITVTGTSGLLQH